MFVCSETVWKFSEAVFLLLLLLLFFIVRELCMTFVYLRVVPMIALWFLWYLHATKRSFCLWRLKSLDKSESVNNITTNLFLFYSICLFLILVLVASLYFSLGGNSILMFCSIKKILRSEIEVIGLFVYSICVKI